MNVTGFFGFPYEIRLEKISLSKIIEAPWNKGIDRLEVDKMFSDRTEWRFNPLFPLCQNYLF